MEFGIAPFFGPMFTSFSLPNLTPKMAASNPMATPEPHLAFTPSSMSQGGCQGRFGISTYRFPSNKIQA